MFKFAEESMLQNKEALLVAISSLLHGHNLKGKRAFVADMNGLLFLEYLIKEEGIAINLKA